MTAEHRLHRLSNMGVFGLILDVPIEDLRSRPPPPTTPIPHRERRYYLSTLSKARSVVSEVGRENLPELMAALPEPRHVGERVDLEWLAWRDAMLDRAMALGYVVGRADGKTYQNGKEHWSVEAMAVIGTRTIRYPIGGPVSEIGRIPVIGRAVLMTRGYHAEERWDHKNRPYIPVGAWFLHDPVDAS